jgi:hypothetical protein
MSFSKDQENQGYFQLVIADRWGWLTLSLSLSHSESRILNFSAGAQSQQSNNKKTIMPPISKKWQAKLMAATALNNDIHTLYQYSHKYHRCLLSKKKKIS